MEGEIVRAPLLKRYYENCPGCLLEQRKERCPGIPYKDFLFVWIVTLSAALPISSLFPFLYFMIRDLHVAERTEDIGFYAGFVGSSFMLGRAFTSLLWGTVADRHGRKPVIVIGILAVIVFNTLFGLSTSYWMTIVTRLLLGLLNGIFGTIKAYAIEVSPSEHQALGLSVVSTAWGVGLIVGPAIGGYLAQPAEKFPHVFSQDGIFGRFPYFLPCLCISIFAIVVLFICIWLPETLHMHHGNQVQDIMTDNIETPSHSLLPENDDEYEENVSAPKEKLFTNWPLMSSIIVYCIFSIHDMAYTEIFSLWAESERKYGGLGFLSGDVGGVLSISGCILLVYQLLLYPPIEKAVGAVVSSRFTAALSIPLLAAYPFMTNLSGVTLKLVVNLASLLKNVFSNTIITGMFILQNNAVSQNQRGAANGIAMTLVSICKAIAPASAGTIFSWAQKRQQASFLPGNQMVFFILNVIELVGFVATFKPFLALPKK